MYGPVIAASNLTDSADPAIRQGHAIAAQRGVPFTVCHVVPEMFRLRVLFPQHAGVDPRMRELEERARAALRARLDAVLGPEAAEPVSIHIESGSAHAGILAAAERLRAWLVVVGVGATAQRVARSAAGAVLVARPSASGGAVLGATDFSDPALPAVQMAAAEAARRGARLRLVHCLDLDPTAYLSSAGLPGMAGIAPLPASLVEGLVAAARERLAGALAACNAEGEAVVMTGPPAHAIVDAAREVATVLVVVGTHGRTGLSRLAIGSTAEAVIARAPCSVLVVPLQSKQRE